MLNTIRVREWMSKPLISVSPDTPINDAYHIMKDNHIRRLPVIMNGNLVGIITVGDIREAQPSDATTLDKYEMNYLIDRVIVEDIMTTDVITVGIDDTIVDAAKLLLDHKIGGLPVMNALGMPIGILTESDIFRLVIKMTNKQTGTPAI